MEGFRKKEENIRPVR